MPPPILFRREMSKENLDSDLWVDRYGDTMYRYTLVRVRDADAAEEIVQSTFVAALEASKSFKGQSSEKSWLFGILKHKIFDHFRRTKRYRSFDLLPGDDPDPLAYHPDGQWKQAPRDWRLDPEKAAENTQLIATLPFSTISLRRARLTSFPRLHPSMLFLPGYDPWTPQPLLPEALQCFGAIAPCGLRAISLSWHNLPFVKTGPVFGEQVRTPKVLAPQSDTTYYDCYLS